MMDHIANHCEELHRRHVHIATVAIAVALSVGLYFVLPILLLAREIAMSTPIIHRFNVVNAQDYQYASSTVPAPLEASGPCPAGQYLGKTEKGEAQCMYKTDVSSGGQSSTSPEPTQPAPIQPMQGSAQVYPMPPGVTCSKDEVYTKNDEGKLACVRMGQPNDNGPEMEEEFINPREIKLALSDISKMKSDLKRSATKLKKLQNTADDLHKITEIQTQLDQYQKDLKNPTEEMSIGDIIHEFRDNNFWEEVQAIRAKVELPTEIARLNKDLARVKKLVGNKTYAKLGFDMTAFAGRLDEIAANIKSIHGQYNAGELEAAMEEMRDVGESGHPGEIYGVLARTRDILQRTKSIRSKDIRTQITEIIQPVIDSFNAGDYRDASEALDQISQELMQLQTKMMRATNLDEVTSQRFEKLQQMIDDKLGKQPETGEAMPPSDVRP